MDNKPWYEKIYIWIGIIAGIFAILGISIFGDSTLDFENNEFGDQSPIFTGDGDNKVIYNNNYYTNTSSESERLENDISLNTNTISLDYAVATDERFKDVFLTNFPNYVDYTDLSEPKNKYYIENNCVTIMNISNQTDHEIKINKFRVVAEEIIQNLEPVISTSFESGSSVDIKIANEGWSDIGNLELLISDKDNLLTEYYNEKDLIFEISGLKIGEIKTLHILDKSLMKKIPDISDNNYIVINPIFNFTSKEIVVSKEEQPIYIYNYGPSVAHYGALGTSVYGIMINTNSVEWSNEFFINECVESGDILDIPICFFPDKSCKMNFYVEFDIYDGFDTETIKSEIRCLDFKISSLNSDWPDIYK